MTGAGSRHRDRLIVVFLAFVVAAALLVARAAWIQVKGDPRLARMAKRQFFSRVLVRPNRANIVDRNGEPLVVSAEVQSLAANPKRLQSNRHYWSRILSRALDLPQQKLRERLSDSREFVWIKRHLSERDRDRLKRIGLVNRQGQWVDGLWLVQESQRAYPHGELATHVLGGTDLDGEGIDGIELWANSHLQGQHAKVSGIRDALGRTVFVDAGSAGTVREAPPLVLTLDASLQFAVEQALSQAMTRTRAQSGSVVVMDSVTGELLALAVRPGSDRTRATAPSRASGMEFLDLKRNRAVTDPYEPGSTLKPLLLASALGRGMRLSDRIHGEGGSVVIQGKRISEAESHEQFGWLSLKEWIVRSSNVVSAKLALKLGRDTVLNGYRAFGLGARTGLGFPGESAGKIPKLQGLSMLELANLGFGQGLTATPIQVARAYGAILNGGWLVQPVLISGQAGQTPPRRVMSAETAQQIQSVLEAVVDPSGEGTGKRGAIDGYRIAGKTGTAQAVDPGTGRYSKTRYFVSFAGFALGVRPKVVIFVGLDYPKGSYYAAETAAPLFREVQESVLRKFSIPPSRVAPRLANAPAQAPSKPATVVVKLSAPDRGNRVPLLTGLTPGEALRLLSARNWSVEIKGGSGLISAQHPSAGSEMGADRSMRLVLGGP